MLSFSNAHSFGLRGGAWIFFSPAQAADGGAEEGASFRNNGKCFDCWIRSPASEGGFGYLPLLCGKTKTRFAPTGGSYDAGQLMIGTVLMLFCGLPAMTRSL